MYLRESLVEDALFLLDDLGDLEGLDLDSFLYRFEKMLNKIGWSLDARETKGYLSGAMYPKEGSIILKIPLGATTEDVLSVAGHELVHAIQHDIGVFHGMYSPRGRMPVGYFRYFYQAKEMLAYSFNMAYGLVIEGDKLSDVEEDTEDIFLEVCERYQSMYTLSELVVKNFHDRLKYMYENKAVGFLSEYPNYYIPYMSCYGVLYLLENAIVLDKKLSELELAEVDKSNFIFFGSLDEYEYNEVYVPYISKHERLRNLVKKYKRRIEEFL